MENEILEKRNSGKYTTKRSNGEVPELLR